MQAAWLPIASLSLLSTVCNAEPDSVRQDELMHLLKQDCGSCHGMTLKGGLGPALLPESLNGKSTAFIVSSILDGRTGTAMPPWRSMLNTEEATWIAEQLQRGVQ